MKKKVIIAVVIVALVALVGWRTYTKVKKSPDAGRRGGKGAAVAVEIAPVGRQTVCETGKYAGSLEPRSLYVVAPKVAGRLEQLTVNIGDPVKSGQLIARLDDDEYSQQVEQAKAELAVAEAGVADCKSQFEAAERELARVRALHEKNVASESELDETDARYRAATAKHNVALAEVNRREAALKAAFVRLSYTRIQAAWDDSNEIRTVGERYVDQGEMLSPNEPIVSILDNTVVTALIDVIERDYPKLSIGQPVTMTTDAFPGRVFSGQVMRISPLLKEASRQARVEIEIPNADGRLKPGMYIRAEIELARHDSVTVVPVSALARRDDRTGVFTVDTGQMTAQFTEIEPGITDGGVVEVITPEMSGSVITMGHHLLEDGGAILLPETEPSRPARGKGPEGRP